MLSFFYLLYTWIFVCQFSAFEMYLRRTIFYNNIHVNLFHSNYILSYLNSMRFMEILGWNYLSNSTITIATYRHDHRIVDYVFEKFTVNINMCICKCFFYEWNNTCVNMHLYTRWKRTLLCIFFLLIELRNWNFLLIVKMFVQLFYVGCE